jgi:hypothetical protein
VLPRQQNIINSLSGSNKYLLSDQLTKQSSKAVNFKRNLLDRMAASEKIKKFYTEMPEGDRTVRKLQYKFK